MKLTSTNVRATLVVTEAPASTNQMASPATVHLAGLDPAVRSVSDPSINSEKD